jgi:hypothetical protein
MATVPSSGTNIRFLSGIKFSNDYKHTRWFDSAAEQLSWWANQPTVYTYSDFNIQRVEDKTFIRLNVDIDSLWGVNYVVFYNKTQGRHFYAFVTKLEYIQKNRTDVHIQLDLIQTWMFDMNWQPSFVAREHCQQVDGTGFPITYTVDEGLNYGTEYRTVQVQNYQPCEGIYFLVVCVKKTMHSDSNVATNSYYGSVNGVPQLLVYYVQPFRLDGSVPVTNLGNVSQLPDLLAALYTQTDAINNIVSLYITDCLPNNPSWDGSSLNFDSNNYQYVSLSTALNGTNMTTLFVTDMNYGSWIWDAGGKYDGFTGQSEVKLNSYPYRVIELTDLRGNSITIKPEYIDSIDLVINISTALGTENKVAYTVKDYLNGSLSDDGQKIKINIQNSLINNSPNDVPIMADMLGAYLQGNRNSINNRKASIMWNGAFDAARSGLNAGANVAMGNEIGAVQSVLGGVQGLGNTNFQLRAIEAKQQDISHIPPSISNLGGNTHFDYGNGLTGLWIIKKEITPEYQNILTNYFNVFGYKVNRVKLPNLHTRQNWNYIETKSCIIQGSFNHEDLEEIKSVFDSGITLWHTDNIGNYSLSNGVIANG